ncbi:MAG: hypothetical protein IKP95_02220 [Ruminococcus sp.]|nr:hypothetical protein [Ruminococcus sp.]
MSLYDDLRGSAEIGSPDIISGIVTGIVKENYNKDQPGKIRVELFLGEDGKNVTGWIPVMAPYGGSSHGSYTLPEVGAEVVVAFNMGDRNRPVVIGCLWSEKNKLPEGAATEKNTLKTFVTKGGSEITMDDTEDKAKITVKTKKGNGFEINEEKESISLFDKENKNSIEINSKEGTVTLSADKKIVLKVGGSEAGLIDGSGKKISFKSTTVELSADKDLTLKGQNTTLEGTQVKVSGSGSLEASSSGTTQIKGTMVKIN